MRLGHFISLMPCPNLAVDPCAAPGTYRTSHGLMIKELFALRKSRPAIPPLSLAQISGIALAVSFAGPDLFGLKNVHCR